MRSQIAFRSETPNPQQYDSGSGYYILGGCVGTYIDDRVLWLDQALVAISNYTEVPASSAVDIGGGYYALETCVGLFINELVLAPTDSDRNSFRCDGVGGCSFVTKHTQKDVVITDWRVDGVGGCEFTAVDEPTFRCDGRGGCSFVPTRQAFLQMDGRGGMTVNAVNLAVAGLSMAGAGGCAFVGEVVAGSVSGSFRCDGQGGMEIIGTIDQGHVTGDGSEPSGGGGTAQRWNWAF